MCYAFSDSMIDANLGHTGHINKPETEAQTQGIDQSIPDTPLRKRSASTTLQHEPAKATKLSSNDGIIDMVDEPEVSDDVTSGNNSLSTIIEQLQKANQEIDRLKDDKVRLKDKADKDVDRLENKVAKLENEYHEEKVRAIEAENEVEKLEEKLKAKAPNRKPGADLSKRLEDDIKAKYEAKAQTQQSKHDQRFTKLKDNYQQKLNEHKNNYQKKIDELKEENKKRESEWKDSKAEHQKVKKQLQLELQIEIKKALPELKYALKEATDDLKERETKIAGLKEDLNNLRTNETTLRYEVEGLDAGKKALQDSLRTRDAEVVRLQNVVQGGTEMIERLKHKLSHEGERWQLQYDRAERYTQQYTNERRTNRVLWEGQERNTTRLKHLEAELHEAKEEVAHLKNRFAHGISVTPHAEGTRDVDGNIDEVKYLGDWSANDPTTANSMVTVAEVAGPIERLEDIVLLGDWSAATGA